MVRKALLIAHGGGSSGFRKVEATTPEALLAFLPVANRPLIEHFLESLADAGVRETAIVASSGDVERIRPAVDRLSIGGRMDRVAVFEHPAGFGLADALALASPVLGQEPYVLHLGEFLCSAFGGTPITAAIGPDDAIVLIRAGRDSRFSRRPDPEGAELAPPSAGPRIEHVGIYAVGSRFGEAVAEAVAEIGDEGSFIDHARAAVRIMDRKGGQVLHRRQPDAVAPAENSKSFLDANHVALGRLQPTAVPEHVYETSVEGVVVIDPTAVVESSTLRGPLIIGEHAQVRTSYIGPFTAVGQHVTIEGAEIEDSVILDGASILNIGSRLESSIVGYGARVSRDFSVPRAVRLDLGPGARVSLG